MLKFTHNNTIIYIQGYQEGLNSAVYREESITVQIMNSSETDLNLTINNSFVASYLLTTSGTLTFELNYALLGLSNYSSFSLGLSNTNGFNFSHTLYIKPGISTNLIVHPIPREIIKYYGPTITSSVSYKTRDQIFPPNVLYKTVPGIAITDFPPIIFESTYDGYTYSDLTSYGYPNSYIISTSDYYLTIGDVNKKYYNIKIEEIDECEEYAIVRWISSFGNIRQHAFKINTMKTEIENQELIVPGNGFRNLKNRKDSIVLYISGLTRYSLWYYSDLLTSGEIHMTTRPEEGLWQPSSRGIDALSLDNTLVEVADSEVEYQPANDLYDLELTVNIKNTRRF